MNMFARSMVVVTIAMLFGSTGAVQGSPERVEATSSPEQSLIRFLQWAPGEYDNNEQVWQESLDKVATPHLHSHVIVVDAHARLIGAHTLIVQGNVVGESDKTPRLHLLSVIADPVAHAIRLDVFTFVDEATYSGAYAKPDLLAAITPADVVLQKGCSIYLSEQDDYFAGSVKPATCRIHSGKRGREVAAEDFMRLSADSLWLSERADGIREMPVSGQQGRGPSRNRRVRYFSGWTIVKKAGTSAALDDQAMWSMVHFVIHNEGEIVPILDDKSGANTGYSLQLAQLTYQNTHDPVLKLGLIENKSGRTVAYSWASTNAKQIGMNLRWFQAGVTQRRGDAGKFGFIQTR